MGAHGSPAATRLARRPNVEAEDYVKYIVYTL